MSPQLHSQDSDVTAIRELIRHELSLSWSREKDGNWDVFTNTFLPDGALFPAARPVKPQTLDQFLGRLKQLRADGKLHTFEVNPLGCDVQVFGNVAIAFAVCRLLENQTTTNHELNATLLVREAEGWRIAAQAWDVESDSHKIPPHLLTPIQT